MYKLNRNYQLLELICGSAFLHFPLSYCGFDIDKGYILVTDDDKQARLLERMFTDTFDATSVLHCNPREWKADNYEMLIHCYRQSDKEELLQDFLLLTTTTPVLIVAGIVPTGLCAYGYPVRCNLDEDVINDFSKLYKTMKDEFIKNPSNLENELDNLYSSKIYLKYKTEADASRFIRAALALGKLWALIIRMKHDENVVEAWLDEFVKFSIETEKAMDDFDGFYGIEEAVRTCVLQYFQQNSVAAYQLHDKADLQEMKECFLYDSDNYYFTEAFLKKVSAPLLQTVSFLQLKGEMHASGMLSCDSTRDNYTVKVTCLDAATEKSVRKRFLKIKKEFLETDEGLALEDLASFQNEENINLEKMEVATYEN